MRTNHGTLAALNADIFIPNGDFKRDVTLFPLGGRCRKGAINGHRANRKLVAFIGYYHPGYVFDKSGSFIRHWRWHFDIAGYLVWNFNLMEIFQCNINSVKIHLNNVFASFTISLLNRIFDSCDCLIFGKNVSDSKETCLHNGVDSNTQPYLASHMISVYDVEFHLLVDKLFLHFPR